MVFDHSLLVPLYSYEIVEPLSSYWFFEQAGFFMLPPRIWTSLEGGLLNSFGMEGKSVVMLTEAAK